MILQLSAVYLFFNILLVINYTFCHTQSNLGISPLLEILQSCKMGHEVGGWVGGSLVGNQTPK